MPLLKNIMGHGIPLNDSAWIVSFVVTAALGSLLGCGEFIGNTTVPPIQAEANEPRSLTVNIARAALDENVYEVSSSFGTLKARRSSAMGFARAGRVSKVLVEIGNSVNEGDRIAELEQKQLQDQQTNIETNLAAANERLATLNAANFRSQENQRQISQSQQQIERLTAQQEEVERELELGVILAPYEGLIAECNADEGDTIASGRPYFKILESGQSIVELNLSSQVAARLQVGQTVWIKKNQGYVQAEVATLSPELSPSARTQSLTLNINDSDQGINWTYGEVVEVQFWIPTEKSGFWVPYSALQRETNNLWSLYVLEIEGERQIVGRRILELLQLEDKHALVRGSINEGDFFIIDGLNRVVLGQRVVGSIVANEYQPPGPPKAGE